MRTWSPASIRRSAIALLSVFLIAAGFVVGSAGLAHAEDVTWTVRTSSNSLGADRTNYAYSINPGSSVDDAIVIANHGGIAVDLSVYAADGYTTDSGEFDVLVGGATSASIGAWVHPKIDRLTVGPGESVEVPFTVQVPDNATPGDYAGAILTSLVAPDQASGISVDRRLGIRMGLRVGGELAPSLAVENPQLAWDGGLNPFAGGTATLSYTIHNTGNTIVSADQAAAVTGPFGWLRTDAADIAAPPKLLPGESWDVSIPVGEVPPMFWLTGAATVIPVVTDASGSTTALAPVEASAGGWAVPWMLLLIVVLIAAAIVLTLVLVRRSRRRRTEREDARVQEAVERALSEKGALAGERADSAELTPRV
ncbi:DUF916 domain-containing protein [Microbacterium rhizomatis]|uniref:DUF916 domain-containing protein n=1 Tax=Microbacterium rhizomatis TaxID=1631477 RepID=A0A5J5J3W3_9MICO|nr:DUF916 domain-containing protein [Microbacterium rhizomatis]KAA9108239.1 DUF916 domain-containing protein [Microbacterium rhizomatis]